MIHLFSIADLIKISNLSNYKSFTIFFGERVEKIFCIILPRFEEEWRKTRQGKNRLCCKQGEPPPPPSTSQPSANGKFNLPACSAFLFDRAQIQNLERSCIFQNQPSPRTGVEPKRIYLSYRGNEFAPWKWIVLVPFELHHPSRPRG